MPVQGNAAFARVFSVHRTLQSGERCTAVGLGEALGVSERTIRRTIELMRDRLGAPIDWEPSTKTYFYTRPWTGLEGVNVNTAEALALILAEQCFRGLRGSPIATALHALLDKMADNAGDQVRHSWTSLASAVYTAPADRVTAREQEHFTAMADAVRKRSVVRIRYAKPADKDPVPRTIHPLGLAELDRRWVVVAFDPAAGGIRKFLLARINTCRRLRESFTPPEGFDLDAYLGGSMGLFTGDTAFTVEAVFSAYAEPYLREDPWHPSQVLRALPDGGVRARWQVNHLLDIQRKLLSWGRHVTVLGPPELAATFADIAKDFSRKYTAHGVPDTSCPGHRDRV